jgi:hypothetical protein
MSARLLPLRRAALCAVLFVLASALPALRSSAQSVPLTESQAKAAFVLNFARFVEWPAGAFATREAPVVACVLGRDGVATALQALDGRPVQGRVLKFRRVTVADELRDCHVAFLGETDERRLVPLLRGLAGRAVLTVGDAEHFIDVGGAIGLVVGEERLQFEINRAAIDQAQLKASANLLRLARNAP